MKNSYLEMLHEAKQASYLQEARSLRDPLNDKNVEVSMYDTSNSPRTKLTVAALNQYMQFIQNYKSVMNDFADAMVGFVGGDQIDGKPQTKADVIKNWHLIKISLSNKRVGLEFDGPTKMGDHTILADVENGKLVKKSITE